MAKKEKTLVFTRAYVHVMVKLIFVSFVVLFYLKPFPQFLSFDAFAPAVFSVNQLPEFYLKV